VLAGQKIPTTQERYWADVEGDVENVEGVLRITRMRVVYHLKVAPEKADRAREALRAYLKFCPAAQTVKDCIEIRDRLELDETG